MSGVGEDWWWQGGGTLELDVDNVNLAISDSTEPNPTANPSAATSAPNTPNKPTASPTPKPTSTPTNTISPQNPTVPSSPIQLTLDGGLVNVQISNFAIIVNPPTQQTNLSFTVAVPDGSAGVGNFTVPKNIVHSGGTPRVYVNEQLLPYQVYTQDADNYYITAPIATGTREFSIIFSPAKTSIAIPPWLTAVTIMGVICVAILITIKKRS
jgi:hypothetical protein